MIFPWGTDAPIYHRPLTTIGVIVVNVLIFVVFPSPAHQDWMLELGGGVHPLQWLSNIFMHLGFGHLLGNMIFLWAFGIIVEGKLGALGFLGVYLAMGVGESALFQFLARPEEVRYMLGASGAIFGLMALCLLWAPRNDLHCVVFFRIFPFECEIPILWFAGFYIAWDVLGASASSFAISTALIHAGGAASGALAGLLMLRLNLVDCEGWDLLSLMRGRRGGGGKSSKPKWRSESAKKRQTRREKTPKEAKRSTDDQKRDALLMLRGHLDADEIEAALTVYKGTRRRFKGWRPPDSEWLGLIKALLDQKAWDDSLGVMRAYLDESQLPSPKIRLRLADVLIRRLDRPVAGRRVLDGIPDADLTAPLAEVRSRLVAIAEQKLEEGVLEIDDEIRGV